MSHEVIIPYRYPDPVEYMDVEEFPGYRVGTDASVWTCKLLGTRPTRFGEWKRKITIPDKSGYHYVSLCHNGKQKSIAVHKLVLEAFCRKKPDGMECCHGPDFSPTNSTFINIRWDTPKENYADKILNGQDQRGENANGAKLTAAQVAEIRGRYAAGGVFQRELAAEFGVCGATISFAISGARWAFLPLEQVDV